MSNEEIKTVLNHAQCELRAMYKRVGNLGGNVLSEVDAALDKLMNEPADPYGEWRGVPVTVDALKGCPLFVHGEHADGNSFEPIHCEWHSVMIYGSGKIRVDNQEHWDGLYVNPADIHALIQFILCLDPKAFQTTEGNG